MSHDRAAAKAKERETRKALGPRLGHSKIGARTATSEPSKLQRRRNRQPLDSDSQY